MPLAVLLVVAAVTSPLEELLGDVDALQRVLVPPAALASLREVGGTLAVPAAEETKAADVLRPLWQIYGLLAPLQKVQAASTAEADADEEIDCDATKILGNLGEDDPDAEASSAGTTTSSCGPTDFAIDSGLLNGSSMRRRKDERNRSKSAPPSPSTTTARTPSGT